MLAAIFLLRQLNFSFQWCAREPLKSVVCHVKKEFCRSSGYFSTSQSRVIFQQFHLFLTKCCVVFNCWWFLFMVEKFKQCNLNSVFAFYPKMEASVSVTEHPQSDFSNSTEKAINTVQHCSCLFWGIYLASFTVPCKIKPIIMHHM